MEKFVKPEMEIVEFDSNDVIVTSNEGYEEGCTDGWF